MDWLIPRCFASGLAGTSLLQEIVYLVSQGADPDEIGLMNIDEQLPVLEYPQPGLDIIQVKGAGFSFAAVQRFPWRTELFRAATTNSLARRPLCICRRSWRRRGSSKATFPTSSSPRRCTTERRRSVLFDPTSGYVGSYRRFNWKGKVR